VLQRSHHTHTPARNSPASHRASADFIDDNTKSFLHRRAIGKIFSLTRAPDAFFS